MLVLVGEATPGVGAAGEPRTRVRTERSASFLRLQHRRHQPQFSENKAGATTGQLAVSDGDIVMWECHIINDSDVSLAYTNEVKTGEMCNLWGASVGIERWGCDLQ